MDAEGIWVVAEDISYSAVVANPSDEATAKLEKLKVNDTTYGNWTKEEIKTIASEAGGGKLYKHNILVNDEFNKCFLSVYSTDKTPITSYAALEPFLASGMSVYFENLTNPQGIAIITNKLANGWRVGCYGHSGTEVTWRAFTFFIPSLTYSDTVVEL